MDTLNKTRVDVVPDPRSPSTQMSVGELRVWLARLSMRQIIKEYCKSLVLEDVKEILYKMFGLNQHLLQNKVLWHDSISHQKRNSLGVLIFEDLAEEYDDFSPLYIAEHCNAYLLM